MQLIVAVTRLVRSLPIADRLVYETQIRKAAVSVASALAEGCGRLHTRELRQYTYIARGSVWEVETQVLAIQQTTSAPKELVDLPLQLSDEIGRMCTAMGGRLTRKKPRRPDLGSDDQSN